jgi:hypothetical protein
MAETTGGGCRNHGGYCEPVSRHLLASPTSARVGRGGSCRWLVVPRRSSLNVGHAAFRARGEVIARALCRPGTSSRSPWLHPASRRAVAAHVG